MTRLFEIKERELVELNRKALEQERQIEDWVEADLSLIGVDGVVLGRQVITDHGKSIDILAIGPDGALIIIELKRDRSPRDVVAQVLDYASWICRLTTSEVYELALKLSGKSLDLIFADAFGHGPPETLNATHQMIVVASEVDEATKRIIEYLSEEHDVGINASFFNIFEESGRRWLTTDNLLNQEEVKDRSVKKARAPWSGYYYITGGTEEDRPWAEMRKHGFFSAHGGVFYTKRLDQLKIGDEVFYYQKQNGYLGFGIVTQEKQLASDFVTSSGQKLTDVCRSHYLTKYQDEDMACYAVGIDWMKTLDVDSACWSSGMFANQNVVCKMYDARTVSILKDTFDIKD